MEWNVNRGQTRSAYKEHYGWYKIKNWRRWQEVEAIKNLQYYIKRLPNNYKAIKYENIINEKLNILNKLLEEISI